MKNQLTKMKKSIGYNSEAEIDERIASIEFKMWTGSISLKEEKELLKEIQELKKSRPKVSQVHKLEANIKDDDRGLPLKERRQAANEKFGSYLEEKKKVSEQLKELQASRTQQTGDLPDLLAQKEELSKQIQEKIKERNVIKAERRQAEQEYYKYEAEVRKIRQERAQEERKAREKEWQDQQRQRKADKLDEQPYVAEITLIEQTILFCKGLTASKGGDKTEEKKEVKYDNPDNTEVLMKKEDRDEEFFFAPLKGKKANKSKSAKAESSSKPIRHNAETFQLFSKLKLDAPITTDDVPPLLEKLNAQLEDYQQKVKTWEVEREERKRKILEGDDEAQEKEKEKEKEEEKEEEKAE
eukprot:TRINITY_DN694_c0_g2_i1.p2 TRINITY_DN694_c0_g2~~TRINITY_DN694_c0_g2_i1.p2  ORF type:complete len:417 (-),score=167.58 TRINITY_DN694_c0_g2_i1:93-1157(-)